jgi:hypothetical protein
VDRIDRPEATALREAWKIRVQGEEGQLWHRRHVMPGDVSFVVNGGMRAVPA